MNAPGWFIVGMVFTSGVFMLGAWIVRARRGGLALTGSELLVRLVVLVLWAVGLVVLPLLAEPGRQRGLTSLAGLFLLGPLLYGMRDCRAMDSQR